MQPRLATDVWVRAYLKRLELAHIPAYITAHGDATSGAVMVKHWSAAPPERNMLAQ